MKVHTTNYIDTLITVADDSKATRGEVPPIKGDRMTAANIQYEMIANHPYAYTSDDVVFQVFAAKNDLTPGELEEARQQFFSKGQPCLRTSPLTKTYGWGIHSNQEGKVAMYGMESARYQELVNDEKVTVVMAVRQKRK